MAYHPDSSLEPSPFLVENIGLLPKGRALDVATGNGRNAIFLAKRGFSVEGVDISNEAIKNAIRAASEAGVSIQAETADLEGDYRIKKASYDVIICFNYLQRSLIPSIKEGLKPGGVVVYETFTVDQTQFGRPSNPDFLLKHNELIDLFRDFRCLHYREGISPDKKAMASLVAQKVIAG